MFLRAAAFRADAFAARFLGGEVGGGFVPPPAEQPTGGGWANWMAQRNAVELRRRREREELGIEAKQQRAIDRAAVKIAAGYPQGGLLSQPQVIASPQFDRLLGIVQPNEGQVQALAQAIVDRIAWIVAQQQAQDDEEEMILRLVMEM